MIRWKDPSVLVWRRSNFPWVYLLVCSGEVLLDLVSTFFNWFRFSLGSLIFERFHRLRQSEGTVNVVVIGKLHTCEGMSRPLWYVFPLILTGQILKGCFWMFLVSPCDSFHVYFLLLSSLVRGVPIYFVSMSLVVRYSKNMWMSELSLARREGPVANRVNDVNIKSAVPLIITFVYM